MAYHAGAGGPGFAKQPAGSQRGVGVWKEPGMPWPELLAWKMQSHPSGLTLLLGYWHQASSGANNPVLGKRDSPIAVVMHGSRAPCSSHLLFCFALPVICCFMPC